MEIGINLAVRNMTNAFYKIIEDYALPVSVTKLILKDVLAEVIKIEDKTIQMEFDFFNGRGENEDEQQDICAD